jgi:hypothetical protein
VRAALDARRPKLGVLPSSKLVYLCAEKEQSEKFEQAALKFPRRYLDERAPTLKNFAKVVRSLQQRQLDE